MSRKIKYRVWDNENKSYDDPYSYAYYAMKQDGGLDFYCHGDHYDSCDPGIYIVEQYTGGHDKNGTDIYEGDILDTPGGRCKVVWSDGGWGYQFKVHRTDWFDIVKEFHDKSEVIGNIHETPELYEED